MWYRPCVLWLQEVKERKASWKKCGLICGLKAKWYSYKYGLLWEDEDLESLWFIKQRDGTKRVEYKKAGACGRQGGLEQAELRRPET